MRITVTLALREQRQEDVKFKVSLDYVMKLYLKRRPGVWNFLV